MAAPSSRKVSTLRWRWLLPVIVALAAFHFSPLASTLDRAFFDAASRRPWRAPAIPPGSAIVLMDRATMQALSDAGVGATWPPPRAVFAALIAGLHQAGAKVQVLDFVFLDRSAAAEQDALLGGLAAGIPGVVLGRTERQTPAFWDREFVDAHPAFPLERHLGRADVIPDSDGVLRRYAVKDSLAAAAFSPSPDAEGGLVRWYGGLEHVRGAVPVLSAGRFILAGLPIIGRLAEAAPEGSPEALARALAAEARLTGPGFDEVRERTVFVGANAEGTFDQKPLPVGALEPGVLLNWTAWGNLSGSGFVQTWPGSIAFLAALVVIGAIALVGARGSRLLGPVVAALGLAAAVLFAAYAGLSSGRFLPPATPVMAAGLGLLGVIAENYWTERRRRHEVQAMFGSYVAPEVVELLVRDPSAIRLGGERREATVFFCDLAGFTDLSEQVTPDELLELVNGYLQETSDCLMAHGAYIDKYIGDAVMAVFGAPLAQPDHAVAACRAALAAQRSLAERNVKLARTHGRTLGMRIGINTGEMIVGNLGSERKRNYTVLGDAVNLASRLEAANKEFGTSILLGETTAQLVRKEMVVRPLTALRVKGKLTAVHVAELVGAPGDLTPLQEEFLAAYRQGHELYMARRFSEAVVALARAAELGPSDLMTSNLVADARQLAAEAPPADWQPILSLKTK